MYKIEKNNLSALFSLIRETQELYVPAKINGQTNFAAWSDELEVDLETLITGKSAKDAFFPQSETLYSCRQDGKNITVIPEELVDQDFVIFGMKACDVKGVEVLDRVFLVDPIDTYYAARRAHATLISLACNEPEETCFCKVFGIDASEPQADVSTWIVGEELFWKPNTSKGEDLTNALASLLQETTDDVVKAKKIEIKSIIDRLPYSNLSLDGWNGDALSEKFDSTNWEQLYKACLACGTCTFICPTCQCYDIKDYNTGKEIKRYRCWDSCMYSDFTMMAHGNNRTSQLQRFRQRFMHKLVYYPANNEGVYSCVGCGRCVAKCPSSSNIVKVIKSFTQEGESKS